MKMADALNTYATLHEKISRPTWIEVDHGALANNVRKVRRRLASGVRLMGVIKANAYGHGAVETARTLLRAGADALAVAIFNEAVELRRAGIDAPLLVLGYTPAWQAAEAAAMGIALAVIDAENARGFAEAAQSVQRPLSVHVKINTGMNRLGIAAEEAVAFFDLLRTLPMLDVEGIFTHFATSDGLDRTHAYAQFSVFQSVLTALAAHGLRPPLAHAANTAALLTMPETHLDMVRSGIALYGLDPDAQECPLPDGFRAALSWKTTISQLRWLNEGEAVSYGREYIVERPILTGVLPVGYADGFPRGPYDWGYVLVGGQPAPILGRVCMDQCIVDLTAPLLVNGRVLQGDEVVLLGKQGDLHIRAEDAAAHVHTNNYDIVTRILPRVPRVHSAGQVQ